MNSYIAFIRGVNVGGSKKIKMTDLVRACESAGLQNVRTYLQSGNVVFNSLISGVDILSQMIQLIIQQRFDLSISVILRTPGDLQQIICRNPFSSDDLPPDKLSVTFLSGIPEGSRVDRLRGVKDPVDKFFIVDREIYLYCPKGFARTRFTNGYFEKYLAVAGTARNWRTVKSLFKMTNEMS